MNIKTIIVDDSEQDLTTLKLKFSSVKEPLYEVTSFNNPQDENIFKIPADLYVFDIDMPKVTGFELAKKINELSNTASVIFCSQHDDLVFESFRLNFNYFIRKSHLDQDFKYAIEKLNHQFINQYKYYLYISTEVKRKIPLQQIISIEVSHNCCSFYLENSEVLTQRKSISAIEKELNFSYFVRIHSSYLINIQYIDSLKSNKAILKNGHILPISRSKLKLVNDAYNSFRIER
ncbi:MAG: response regulator transcription factor [Bacilli bacterium]